MLPYFPIKSKSNQSCFSTQSNPINPIQSSNQSIMASNQVVRIIQVKPIMLSKSNQSVNQSLRHCFPSISQNQSINQYVQIMQTINQITHAFYQSIKQFIMYK